MAAGYHRSRSHRLGSEGTSGCCPNNLDTMPTRWITFDCYGTLVDWQGGFSKILAPLAKGRLGELLNGYHRHEAQVEAERPFRSYKEVLAIALVRAAKEIGIELEA